MTSGRAFLDFIAKEAGTAATFREVTHDARDDGVLGVNAYPSAAVSRSPQLAAIDTPTAEALQTSALHGS